MESSTTKFQTCLKTSTSIIQTHDMRYDVRMILVISRFAVIIPFPATLITGLQLARSLQSVNLIAIPRARNRPLRSYHNKRSAHPSTRHGIRTVTRQLAGTTEMMAYQPDVTGNDHNDQNREDVKRNRTIYTIDYCAPTDPQKDSYRNISIPCHNTSSIDPLFITRKSL